MKKKEFLFLKENLTGRFDQANEKKPVLYTLNINKDLIKMDNLNKSFRFYSLDQVLPIQSLDLYYLCHQI